MQTQRPQVNDARAKRSQAELGVTFIWIIFKTFYLTWLLEGKISERWQMLQVLENTVKGTLEHL